MRTSGGSGIGVGGKKDIANDWCLFEAQPLRPARIDRTAANPDKRWLLVIISLVKNSPAESPTLHY